MSHSFARVMAMALLLACGTAPAQGPADDQPTEVTEIDVNEAEQASREAEQEGESLADEVIAESQDCIQTSRIRRTSVLDNQTLVFYMYGSEIYLNKLPHRCSGLRMANGFSYDVRTGRLCNVDVIRVLESFGGQIRQGVACGLGKFMPITEEQLLLLREKGPEEE